MATSEPMLTLNLRRRIREHDEAETEVWQEQTTQQQFAARQTALLLCDVWDDHWCRSAASRCGVLAQKMAFVVEAARAQGVSILHAPSDCMAFYTDHPARRRVLDLPVVSPPAPLNLTDPPLPIDDSDGGCDDIPQCTPSRPWTRQDAAICIADEDGITDSGEEAYRFLRERDITTLLIMGVHTNMCILKRSFGIRQMTRWGVDCVLLRDLTDTMYNPRLAPFVSHEEGTELVITYIEQSWCPTILSADLLASGTDAP